MFFVGMRTSTIVVIVLFVALGVIRDRRFFWAGLVWIFGWEAFFGFASTMKNIIVNGLHIAVWWAPVVVFGVEFLGIACVIVAAIRFDIRPSWPVMLGVGVCWAIWLGTGFHINSHTMENFSPGAEALNEGAKTLWAIAYIVPLLKPRVAPLETPLHATTGS